MIQFALIGFGKWGQNYTRAVKEAGNCEISKVFISSSEPIVFDRFDAIVVCTPPSVSPEWCERALQAGKPVMVEKPAGLSLEAAWRIVRAEGPLVFINHQHLFADAYERIRAGGPPDRAYAQFTGPVERDYPALWDYGPHAVSCLLGLGVARDRMQFAAGVSSTKTAFVAAWQGGGVELYDGYAAAEPPLTRSVRAFAKAVKDGGTDDWRFGAHWAVDVAEVLSSHNR